MRHPSMPESCHNRARDAMPVTRCLFASDLHGRSDRYDKLFAAVGRERPAVLFLGGDLLPHPFADGAPGDFFAEALGPAPRGSPRRARRRLSVRPRDSRQRRPQGAAGGTRGAGARRPSRTRAHAPRPHRSRRRLRLRVRAADAVRAQGLGTMGRLAPPRARVRGAGGGVPDGAGGPLRGAVRHDCPRPGRARRRGGPCRRGDAVPRAAVPDGPRPRRSGRAHVRTRAARRAHRQHRDPPVHRRTPAARHPARPRPRVGAHHRVAGASGSAAPGASPPRTTAPSSLWSGSTSKTPPQQRAS